MKQKELEKQGWQRQTTYDESRLDEIIENYEEMGFDVRLEPFDGSEETGCSECMKAQPERYMTVYTRKRNAP